MFRFLVVAGLVMQGGAAAAESYSVAIMGENKPSVDACVAHGIKVFQAYVSRWGGDMVETGMLDVDGLIYGWDLRPGDNDALVICVSLDDGALPIIVLHGDPSDSDDITSERLQALWHEGEASEAVN